MHDLHLIAPPPAGIIGLCGHAGSGKTYLARQVRAACSYPTIVMTFAAPLKGMLEPMLAAMGVDDDTVERMLFGDMKEAPIGGAFGDLTTRKLMQTLGTEWGRRSVDPDLWTKLMRRRAERAMADGVAVIIDDVRVQNEVKLIHELGGKVVCIKRPGAAQPAADAHVSEVLPLYDETYMNEVPA